MYIFEQDGDYVNFNGGGNLWRIHKNSQCIAWHWDETGDLFFDVYDQQYVVKAENIATVTIGGVTLSTAADFETNIKLVFPGLAGGGTSSYLVYTALLNQTGTDAPIPTVLENTLGGTVVWTRDSQGVYLGTLAGAFTAGKTALFIGNTFGGLIVYAFDGWDLPNVVYIQSYNNNVSVDSTLTNTPIQIQVYS